MLMKDREKWFRRNQTEDTIVQSTRLGIAHVHEAENCSCKVMRAGSGATRIDGHIWIVTTHGIKWIYENL